ncbi:MAG: hypothetical protein CL431_07655 [Acidimicrobiaceae bacterium]|nr:hypothetical protein [Acidimicrobiaceae bacterium]
MQDNYLSTDVLIVGAGPAGCAAAIDLCRKGVNVTIIDKAAFPRDKCCGDGLTTDALRILDELGLRPESIASWNTVTDAVIYSPKRKKTTLPLPKGKGQFAAIAPRIELDHQLLKLACKEGANLLCPLGFLDIEQLDDHVKVKTTDDTDILARYVIAADGMWSSVRKATNNGIERYRGDWHAFRQYFSNTGPNAQHLTVWFETDLLPGYVWLFPLPGQRANVGFGILRDHNHRVQDMGRLWKDILTRPHINEVLGAQAIPEGTHKAWPIPTRMNDLKVSKNRVLFAGDAIGIADPMTGEGIAQALLSGRLAALALLEAGPFDPSVAESNYQSSLDKSLARDHKFAGQLQSFLTSSLATEMAIKASDINGWTRRNFARWLFEDYPRALIFTPDRWKPGALTSDGAYKVKSRNVSAQDEEYAFTGEQNE